MVCLRVVFKKMIWIHFLVIRVDIKTRNITRLLEFVPELTWEEERPNSLEYWGKPKL